MRGRSALIFGIAGVGLALTALAQAPASRLRTPAVLPITAITVSGNKMLTTYAILAASGLKVNENGGSAIFDAARDRLLDTGYFDVVSYTFHQQDLGFVINFNVTELKQVYPVHAEALPITLDQLGELLRSKDPLYDGLLPGSEKIIRRAASAIEQFLAPTHPEIRVQAKVIPVGPERYEVEFSPAEGVPVIADVTFTGSKVVAESVLHDAMIENGIGRPYTDASVHSVLDRYIRPLFEKQGYMRVAFPQITGTPAAKVKGIDVHVTVVDGPRFRMGTLSVRGAMAGQSNRILRMANVTKGEFANGDELTQGATKIHDTLRGEGYMDVTVSTDHSINEASGTVDAWFDVNPGPQYTFGHLEVLGLGLDGEAAIRKMWTVKPGDPYPGDYPEYFVKSVKAEGLFDNLGDITETPSINHQTHVVDVSLHFASAGPPQARRSQR